MNAARHLLLPSQSRQLPQTEILSTVYDSGRFLPPGLGCACYLLSFSWYWQSFPVGSSLQVMSA
jgi:hypothetical protein